MLNDFDDVVGFLLKNIEIVAADFCDDFAAKPRERLFNVVLNDLREISRDAWNDVQGIGHAADQRLFAGEAPGVAGFQVNQILEIIRTLRIRSVVRAAHLSNDVVDFGVSEDLGADQPLDVFGGLERCRGWQRDGEPYVSFIELWHEFATQTSSQSEGDHHRNQCKKKCLACVVNGEVEQFTVAVLQPVQPRFVSLSERPLLHYESE